MGYASLMACVLLLAVTVTVTVNSATVTFCIIITVNITTEIINTKASSDINVSHRSITFPSFIHYSPIKSATLQLSGITHFVISVNYYSFVM